MFSYSTYTLAEAIKKAENYCAYQERCHQELKNKLLSMNMIPEVVDIVIVHLIENNFLNETRFAINFARGKHRIKHWGTLRIVRELKLREISEYNIKQALKELDLEEYQSNFDILSEKHWLQMKDKNQWTKRKKFCDFLLRKGYESDLIYAKVKTLEQQ